MDDHTVKIIVNDTDVKLDTKAESIPRKVVEQMLSTLLKETIGNIPKSRVDKDMRRYIDCVETSRNLWRFTAIFISTLYFLSTLLNIIN